MLRAQMELKGKCSKKFIRQGVPTIRDVHFDHECNFINSSYDKESGQHNDRIMTVIAPNTTMLMSALQRVQRPKDEAGKRKQLEFKDLLDKMFMLDPERRFTPKDCLNHPFITDKIP